MEELEKHPQYYPLTLKFFLSLEKGEIQAVSSILSLVEVLSSPRLEEDIAKRSDLKRFFVEEKNLELHKLDFDIGDKTAELRRQYHLVVPDAAQLATAILAGTDLFITNDESFRKIKDFPVLFLKDFVS